MVGGVVVEVAVVAAETVELDLEVTFEAHAALLISRSCSGISTHMTSSRSPSMARRTVAYRMWSSTR
ncbi:hypothetical protein GS415_06725 [Rhodococcus hoagii]|nr:hypothetical protein [Prescottella equi]